MLPIQWSRRDFNRLLLHIDPTVESLNAAPVCVNLAQHTGDIREETEVFIVWIVEYPCFESSCFVHAYLIEVILNA